MARLDGAILPGHLYVVVIAAAAPSVELSVRVVILKTTFHGNSRGARKNATDGRRIRISRMRRCRGWDLG
jgi:hypothetical protein